MTKLPIQIWSDIACPWCYVGKRRLEAALARFGGSDEVEVTWRSFELDPAAPPERDASVPYADRLASKYGTDRAEASAMIQRMTDNASTDGLELRFDRIRPGNTFDAHRLLHLALERGGSRQQGALKERLLRGYLTEGAPIGDHATLERLAVEAGLDGEEVRGVLGSDAYARAVRADEAEAAGSGIGGVPFFVIGRYAVSGAQPRELFLRVLEQARGELAASPVESDGAVCGPDGCA